jgi:hypothetical protein
VVSVGECFLIGLGNPDAYSGLERMDQIIALDSLDAYSGFVSAIGGRHAQDLVDYMGFATFSGHGSTRMDYGGETGNVCVGDYQDALCRHARYTCQRGRDHHDGVCHPCAGMTSLCEDVCRAGMTSRRGDFCHPYTGATFRCGGRIWMQKSSWYPHSWAPVLLVGREPPDSALAGTRG